MSRPAVLTIGQACPRCDTSGSRLPFFLGFLPIDVGTWHAPHDSVRSTALGGPVRNCGDAPRAARRPAGKARRPRISGIFEGGATPAGGMHRRPNATAIANGATRQGVHHVPFDFCVLQPPPDSGLVCPDRRCRGTTSRSASGLGHDPDPACAPAQGATCLGAAAHGAGASRAGSQATAQRGERRVRQTRRAETHPPALRLGTRREGPRHPGRAGRSADERAR